MRMRIGTTMVVVLTLVALPLMAACGKGAPPPAPTPPPAPAKPTGPINVVLSWTNNADLDLIVNDVKGYEQGGSDDTREGPGSESLTLPAGVCAIDVYNNSGAIAADATVTLTIPGMESVTRAATVSNEIDSDVWKVLSIDCATGIVTDINKFE